MLKIHHINCGTLTPLGGRLLDGFSHGARARLVSHCWLVENAEGLILVDSGFGTEECAQPETTLNPFMRRVLRPRLSTEGTALSFVKKFGADPRDVKHIVLTQLGFGHAGGVKDFVNARVHVMHNELESATHPTTWLARQRYSGVGRVSTQFETYGGDGQSWYGLPGGQALRGLSEDILFIPLPGHTWGNAGVAVRTDQGWMLHAGAAYFYREEVDGKGYRCPALLRVLQNVMEVNHSQRVLTLERLRRLVRDHSADVRVCSSNDMIEFTAYQASAEPLRKLQKLAALARGGFESRLASTDS